MNDREGRTEPLPRLNRLILVAGLGVVGVASWVYVLSGAGLDMSAAAHMAKPADWSAGYLSVLFVMWWVMMVAMMLPSAMPMIMLFATINRKAAERAAPTVSTLVFVGGYLAVWGGFSIAAVIAQWQLAMARLLSPMMESSSLFFGGLLLLAAGIYQLTPLKDACLRHCRSPMAFIMSRWRPGPLGAFRMGLDHGAICLGCCWVLMSLLFYGGVMNFAWIAGLTVYVLVEKFAPFGDKIGRYAGGVLIIWGVWILWLASSR
ncbi:MAG: DUF2182 domain-containing protein [Rhodospirillaceae bacterium]|nr:DUF2182 domain-containing protein [Rhodospirillaceae bacterium]MBT6138111.1 DUF2182 domain-containing protein [Rhodospirillaceae bacterium]